MMARGTPVDRAKEIPSSHFPVAPPDTDPILTRASVTFHTNDDDKKADSRVKVDVRLSDGRTIVA
jgi:hypothetical protein